MSKPLALLAEPMVGWWSLAHAILRGGEVLTGGEIQAVASEYAIPILKEWPTLTFAGAA